MQYANHINRILILNEKDEMTPHDITTVTITNVITTTTAIRLLRNTLDCVADLGDVFLSLDYIPALLREVPNFREVTLGCWCEPERAHDFFATMKASKSKGSARPLSSPAISAERNAAICVS